MLIRSADWHFLSYLRHGFDSEMEDRLWHIPTSLIMYQQFVRKIYFGNLPNNA